MGLSQMLNSKKGLIILVVVELVACIVLGAVVWKKQKDIKTSETFTNTLIEQVSQAEKVKGEHDNLLQQIQSLKITAGTIAMTSNTPMDRPEQICSVVKQIMTKQQQALNSAAAAISAAKAEAASATSPTAEVDFLVTLVAKEIAGQGVVDTQQTEKFAVVLYHMQKVLDALGYKLNDTIKTTNQAVIKYQTDNQLKADGKIGPKTWVKIQEAWNAKRPGGPLPSAAAATPAAQTKPQSQTQAPAPVKPQSLSSVTTRSSVKP